MLLCFFLLTLFNVTSPHPQGKYSVSDFGILDFLHLQPTLVVPLLSVFGTFYSNCVFSLSLQILHNSGNNQLRSTRALPIPQKCATWRHDNNPPHNISHFVITTTHTLSRLWHTLPSLYDTHFLEIGLAFVINFGHIWFFPCHIWHELAWVELPPFIE